MSYGRRDTLDLHELAEELDDLRARRDFAAENPEDDDAEPLDDDEAERLEALESLESDLGDLHVADRNLSGFVSEDDFEDYAADMAVELGIIAEDKLFYLDREAWARDLRMDCSSVDFDGRTYYYQG